MTGIVENRNFVEKALEIVKQGKDYAYSGINKVMIATYWQLGKHIVEEEQNGRQRADYGKQLIKNLAVELVKVYGNSYNERNLNYFRLFYLQFNDLEILNTRVQNLTWSHIRRLLRVENKAAQLWYLSEASSQNWAVRTLDCNINTQYYERLLLSQKKELVQKEMEQKTAEFQCDKLEFIKNPIVAEFLGLSQNTDFRESDLEKAIITNLQKFLMELGKGYAFVERQQHIRTDENDYFIDLVFYNYLLKCFVLIDLKTDKISFQDVGQMDMYLRMYDNLKKQPDDNPTIGIVLCAETDGDVARFSSLADNPQMYAAKYKLYMPTQEELAKEIERQKQIFKETHLLKQKHL